MSYEEKIQCISLTADGDQSSNQYKFLKGDTTGVALQDSAGGACIGVLQNKPTDAKIAEVGIMGVSKVTAGAAVSLWDNVQSDGAGRAITAASGDYSQGIALEAATAAGQIIAVLLRPQAQLN
jgi:hypothetical protein